MPKNYDKIWRVDEDTWKELKKMQLDLKAATQQETARKVIGLKDDKDFFANNKKKKSFW